METLTFREERFSPAELAACTGLSPSMQRDWRRHGHLRSEYRGSATFSARELAEVRLMVLMRQMGLGPSKSRSLADLVAPSVLWLALADWPESWAVDGRGGDVDAYRSSLEKLGDEHLRLMAGLDGPAYRFGTLAGDTVQFTPALDQDELGQDEITSIVNLDAVAARIVAAAGRPFFTIIAPPSGGGR